MPSTLDDDNGRSIQVYGDADGVMTSMGVDSFKNTINIGSVHFNLHEGKAFIVSRDSGSIADAATSDMLIQVGSTALRFTTGAGTTGSFRADIYEGTTFSAAGTALVAYNKLRSSSNTTNATFTHTPTITDLGTTVWCSLISGGKKVGGDAELPEIDQFILTANTDYLYRLTNISGVAARAIFNVSYYEPGL